jgi:uncharacterized protein (DUF362 family)
MRLDRRSFLKVMGGAAAAAMLPPGTLQSFPFTLQETAVFAVVKGPEPSALVDKALELVGGMSSFVSKGDVVYVKPNISWDRVPEQAATTNPLIVEAVIRNAFEAGAKRVIVADNSCNDARRTYQRSGIKDAAEKAGAKVFFMEKRKFVKTNIGGEIIKEWDVYREAIEADKIINVPIVKHHGLCGVTLSMKNTMGLIGGRRELLHQKLSGSIVDLTAYFRPALNILDAVRVLTAHGPQGGSAKDVAQMNLVAASTDPVMIDAFGVTLFGKDPAEFPHIALAEQRGLGTRDFRSGGFKEVTLG